MCEYEVPQWVHSTIPQKSSPHFVNFQVQVEPSAPQARQTSTKLPSPSSSLESAALPPQKDPKVTELEQRVKFLEERLVEKSKKELPVIGGEEKCFFNYPLLICKANSVTDAKVLSHHALLSGDTFLHNFHLKFVEDYASVKQLIVQTFNGDKQEKLEVPQNNEFAALIALIMRKKGLDNVFDLKLQRRQELATLEMAEKQKKDFVLPGKAVNGAELQAMVLKMLPRIEILRYLWKMFTLYIFPFIPVMDHELITHEISRVFVGSELEDVFDQYQPQTNKMGHVQALNIATKLDYARIAIFLVAARLAYLCVKFNINDVAIRCLIENEMMAENARGIDTIPASFVDVAQVCLECLKPDKKASPLLLAAQILLYNYTELREEGRVGFGLNQSHLALDSIINRAKHMGLNRNWRHSPRQNVFFASTGAAPYASNASERRHAQKLWYYIVNVDARVAIRHGKLPGVASEEEYDVELPGSEEGEPRSEKRTITVIPDYVETTVNLTVDCARIENLTVHNMRMEYGLSRHFSKIALVLNQLRTPVRLQQVVGWIRDMEGILVLGELEPVIRGTETSVAENYYKVIEYIHRLELQMHVRMCRFELCYWMFLHYDSARDAAGVGANSLHFLRRAFELAFDIVSQAKRFLVENEELLLIELDFEKVEENMAKGKCYGFKNFNFIVLPIVDTMCYRAIIVVETMLLRVAHAISVIDGILKRAGSANFLLLLEEYIKKREALHRIYVGLYGFLYRFVKLLVLKIAKFYTHLFKVTLIYLYYMVCFRKPQTITDWFNKRPQFIGSDNRVVTMALNEVNELCEFLEAHLSRDQQSYPDTVPDLLMAEAFVPMSEDSLGADAFGTTVLPALDRFFGVEDFGAPDFRDLMEGVFQGGGWFL